VEGWIEPGEEPAHVLEVPLEEGLGLAVVRRAHHLGKVDHHRPLATQQHVVGREIPVNEVAGEHPDHLPAQIGVQRGGLVTRYGHVH
jgi:hypothetical protein